MDSTRCCPCRPLYVARRPAASCSPGLSTAAWRAQARERGLWCPAGCTLLAGRGKPRESLLAATRRSASPWRKPAVHGTELGEDEGSGEASAANQPCLKHQEI
eukprot:6188694-Pleurochrysis_carterae.AAC.4